MTKTLWDVFSIWFGPICSMYDFLILNFVLLSSSVCPLVFPNMTDVGKECGSVISNQTSCCKSMESYVSKLQQQSFLTNLQALNCAASLGMRLQKANISYNVYNLCHINLKDFSLQGQFYYMPPKWANAFLFQPCRKKWYWYVFFFVIHLFVMVKFTNAIHQLDHKVMLLFWKYCYVAF